MKRYVQRLLVGGGAVLALTATVTANAATVSRSQNIKSHGVYIAQSEDGTSNVRLDSSDLIMLANEIDELEEWYRIAVQEAYNEGWAAHVPNGAQIVYDRHYHNSSCYKTCNIDQVCTDSNKRSDGKYNNYFIAYHSSCGQAPDEGWSYGQNGRQEIGSHTYRDHQYLDCKYSDGQILAAHIIYN